MIMTTKREHEDDGNTELNCTQVQLAGLSPVDLLFAQVACNILTHPHTSSHILISHRYRIAVLSRINSTIMKGYCSWQVHAAVAAHQHVVPAQHMGRPTTLLPPTRSADETNHIQTQDRQTKQIRETS